VTVNGDAFDDTVLMLTEQMRKLTEDKKQWEERLFEEVQRFQRLTQELHEKDTALNKAQSFGGSMANAGASLVRGAGYTILGVGVLAVSPVYCLLDYMERDSKHFIEDAVDQSVETIEGCRVQ